MLSLLLLFGRNGGKTTTKMGLEIGSLKTVKIPLQELQNQLVDLKKQSYVVWPNFLVDADLAELKNDLESRFDAGSLVCDFIYYIFIDSSSFPSFLDRSLLLCIHHASRGMLTRTLSLFHPHPLLLFLLPTLTSTPSPR